MAKSIEDIVGKFDREPVIPGTRQVESGGVRYVSFDRRRRPKDMFVNVVWNINPIKDPVGGVVLEGFTITIPGGISFYALSYHGDIDDWRNQIEQGAANLGFITAKIMSDKFTLSDGRSFLLSECIVELDGVVISPVRHL